VAGSEHDEYVAGTTYAAGNQVKVSFESDGTTPRFPVIEYESLAGSNTGNYPPDSPDKWSEIGAENRCRMFDGFLNTQTSNSDDIEVVVSANLMDAVGLFALYGTKVTLTLKKDTETIKTETIDLRTSIPSSGWYSWLFDTYEYGITQILWEYPRYAEDATLEVTITARSGAAACGMMVLGNVRELGTTIGEPKVSISDYSTKGTDPLGRTYLNQGAYSDNIDVEMRLENTKIDFVKRKLTEIRGTAAIFNCNNTHATVNYQALFTYGCFEDFYIMVRGRTRSKCAIVIKGLI